VRSACRGPTTMPNRLGSAVLNRPGWPQDTTRVYAHGTTHSAPGTLSARVMAWLAVAHHRPNLGKVYTTSFPNPRCTRLTWLRAPAHSEEGGRQRGKTHRRDRRCWSTTTGKVSPSWFRKQLQSSRKLLDLCNGSGRG
jgi:hypothetical protein